MKTFLKSDVVRGANFLAGVQPTYQFFHMFSHLKKLNYIEKFFVFF